MEEIRATARPGRGDAARRALERAIELLEEGGEGSTEDAARAGEEAKLAAPRSGAVREVLGIALYRAGRYRDALRELQTYRRITGRLDQNHLIADSHRGLGASEKAVEAAREALVAPQLPEDARAEAAVVGAAALADLGRFGEALAMLRTLPTTEGMARPSDLRLWYMAGDILERAGRPGEAAEEFRRILRHDPDAFDASERLERLSTA